MFKILVSSNRKYRSYLSKSVIERGVSIVSIMCVNGFGQVVRCLDVIRVAFPVNSRRVENIACTYPQMKCDLGHLAGNFVFLTAVPRFYLFYTMIFPHAVV